MVMTIRRRMMRRRRRMVMIRQMFIFKCLRACSPDCKDLFNLLSPIGSLPLFYTELLYNVILDLRSQIQNISSSAFLYFLEILSLVACRFKRFS